MDRQALVTALFGIAIGALGYYLLIRRSWWRLAGWLAIGAAALLNLATEGPHSPTEDAIKWAATGGLFVIFAVAMLAHQRRARSVPERAATYGSA
jgi:hypothetical protein